MTAHWELVFFRHRAEVVGPDGEVIASWNPLTGLTEFHGAVDKRENVARTLAANWGYHSLEDCAEHEA